jgi:sugar lactone lactonase YvrE
MKRDNHMNLPQCVWNAQATLGEGPVWSVREQALYWVDILNHRLYRYAPDAFQKKRSWQFDEVITSVAERASQPGLIVTLRHGFAFFDPDTEKLTPLHAPESHLPANRFNDGKCDARGRLWAGTMDFGCSEPTGSLYRFDAALNCMQMDTGYAITNGPTWSADHRTMYYNDTRNGHVYAFDFDLERGEISNKRLFLAFGPADGTPDGMTTDAEGGIWIAHWGARKLTRHDADGTESQVITMPVSQPSSCAFGGPDLKTMYITSATLDLTPAQREREPLAGGLFAIEMDVAGLPANVFGG